MLIYARLPSAELAPLVGVKSRKTIENWEKDFCELTINQFLLFAIGTGFNPGSIVAEVFKRNSLDPTQTWDIDL